MRVYESSPLCQPQTPEKLAPAGEGIYIRGNCVVLVSAAVRFSASVGSCVFVLTVFHSEAPA
jgi:hypothetical protein